MTHNEVVEWWWQRCNADHTIDLKDMTDEIAFATYQILLRWGDKMLDKTSAINRAERAEKEVKEAEEQVSKLHRDLDEMNKAYHELYVEWMEGNIRNLKNLREKFKLMDEVKELKKRIAELEGDYLEQVTADMLAIEAKANVYKAKCEAYEGVIGMVKEARK